MRETPSSFAFVEENDMACIPAPLLLILVRAFVIAVVTAMVGATAAPLAVMAVDEARESDRAAIDHLRTADDTGSRVAVAWMDLLYERVKAEGISPPAAARIYGYAAVALYEAVVPGTARGHSLAGQLNGLASLPVPRPHRKHHWPSAANAAVATITRLLLPTTPATLEAIDGLSRRFAWNFQGRASVPRAVHARSADFGVRVAAAIASWASGDGSGELSNCPHTPPVGPGLWTPTPPAFAPPLQPCWGQLRPFVLVTASECAPPPPPAYSEDPASPFYVSGKEVHEIGQSLTPEQITIARYWADGPGATGTPPGHWIAITGQIARRDALSLASAAEGYARVGIAVADAFINCWSAKYDANVLRPITYIQRVIDPTWTPLLPTPSFPEYTSGHSSQSAAAATVLTDIFGERSFTDTTHADHHLVPVMEPRTFTSFLAAAREAAVSRLYGGIHYRPGAEAGFDAGLCIGHAISSRIRFRE